MIGIFRDAKLANLRGAREVRHSSGTHLRSQTRYVCILFLLAGPLGILVNLRCRPKRCRKVSNVDVPYTSVHGEQRTLEK